MNKYPKIETVFERDNKGKLLYGVYRNSLVEYLAKCQWIGTEKIDGTNIGIVWDGYRISFQGRTEKSVIPSYLYDYLTAKFCTYEMEQLFEQMFDDKKVVLFGEGYGNKIQKIGAEYREDNSFILFDVYFPEKNIWLDYSNVADIGKNLGIDVVPLVFEGDIEEAIQFVKKHPKSTIGTALMEGIVIKPKIQIKTNKNERLVVKVKWNDFKDE